MMVDTSLHTHPCWCDQVIDGNADCLRSGSDVATVILSRHRQPDYLDVLVND